MMALKNNHGANAVFVNGTIGCASLEKGVKGQRRSANSARSLQQQARTDRD